jgi:hypothetical protein
VVSTQSTTRYVEGVFFFFFFFGGANPFKTLRTERIGESLDHVNNTIHCHKIGLTVMEQQTHIHLLNEELNNLTWS